MPAQFDAQLNVYTREGLRVLGLATRPLQGLSEGEVQAMSQVRLGAADQCAERLRLKGRGLLPLPLVLHSLTCASPPTPASVPRRRSWRRACSFSGWR